MAGLTAQEQKEMAAFEMQMAKYTARLMDFALPYTRRLSSKDLDFFLTNALSFAWQRRKQFNPERGSLLQWWDGCLKSAALTRKSWRQRHMDYWEVVPGHKLGSVEF